MTAQERERIHSLINELSGNDLSVDAMEKVDSIRNYIDSADESTGEEKVWEEKYRSMETRAVEAEAEVQRVTNAYRQRWNESTTGTLVNGQFVDKVVTEVSDYTYGRLMRGDE